MTRHRGPQRPRARPRAAHRRADPGPGAALRAPAAAQHAAPLPRGRSQPTTTSATSSSRSSSTDTMMYSCAFFESPQASLRAGVAREAREICSQPGPRTPRPRARDRYGLGRVRRPRRRPLWLPRHDDDDLPPSSTPTRAPASREAGLSDRVTVLDRDYRELTRPLRQAGLDRDDRGGRLAVLPGLLRPLLAAAERRRRDAAAGDRDRGRRLRGREGHAQLHQHAHLPGRLPALARM